jgi:hypothetical protein
MKEREIQLDPQWLDNEYEIYYCVPEPDCKFFDEMDVDGDYTFPTRIGGQAVTFVNAEWAANGCQIEE